MRHAFQRVPAGPDWFDYMCANCGKRVLMHYLDDRTGHRREAMLHGECDEEDIARRVLES